MQVANFEDRPINSDKQYLEKKQQEYRAKKQEKQEQHNYLKKNLKSDKVLPCFRQNLVNQQQLHKPAKLFKTKAQVYSEIKQKNLQKFGQKHQNHKNDNPDKKQKKLDPKQMTISFKPKNKIFIDTNEFKKKQYQESQNKKPSPQKKQISSRCQQTAKQKYQKLLQIMHKQKLELAQNKQSFQKHKQKLEFKKMISGQNTVPFIDQIKKSLKEKKGLQKSHKQQCKQNRQNEQQQFEQNIKSRRANRRSPKNKQDSKNNTQHLSEISKKIKQLQQQKQELQDQAYQNNCRKVYVDKNDVVCTKYSIEQVNQIPAFDIECFKQFIDLKTMYAEKNQYYEVAQKIFQTGLSAKQMKMKMKITNLDQIQNNQQNVLNSVGFKRRFQGPSRITKYNNDWIEVWTSGSQRLMANKKIPYKVVWLKNGDIHQEWKDKKLDSYYSKQRQIVKICFQKYQPIYFFIKLGQLQQLSKDKKFKYVMFKDGRIQTFTTEDDMMNGFAV